MPPRESPSPELKSPPSPARWEWIVALLIVLAGLTIRGAAAGKMAVEHFDEGVYASNIWFGVKQRLRYPARHLYAPPFLPWLDEWSQIILGPTHWGTMLPGVLSGTLTIFVCWWAVRRWFGSVAGLVAAALAAFSDYHVIYSRTVLTEPVLCLLLLIAVFFVWRALEGSDFRWAIVAGLCTGLAWVTKYNGWLPLAIGFAGLSAWSILPPKGELRGRRFLVLGVTACVALIAVFPVWRDLQPDGGYRVVQENHARYVVGLAGWLSSWKRQLGNHQFFDGPLSWGGLFLAVVISGLASNKMKPVANGKSKDWFRSLTWTLSFGGAMAAAAMWLGTSVVLGLLGCVWLVLSCPCWNPSPEQCAPSRNLAYWLVAAWFIGLFLTTPLYTPYPRLSLPWLVAAWITAAAMLGSPTLQTLLAAEKDWQSKTLGKSILAVLFVAGLAGIGGRVVFGINHFSPWQDRTGLDRVAAQIQQVISQKFGGRAAVYVYAEPALFYHLRADDVSAVPVAFVPISEPTNSVPVLFVVGPHARRSPAFQKEWQLVQTRFGLLGNFSYLPSDLVLLNQYSAEEVDDPNFEREQTIQLYLTNPL